MQHASHHHFGTLLKRGVKIWEYDRTLLHQKVMIIDGLWSSVGSTNFDDRSFQLNDEINVGVLDPGIAKIPCGRLGPRPEACAGRIELAEWRQRGWRHPSKDRLA